MREVRGQRGPQDGMAIFKAVFATPKRWDLILKVRANSWNVGMAGLVWKSKITPVLSFSLF